MDKNSREGETSESHENPANSGRRKEAKEKISELENVGVNIKSSSAHQNMQTADRVEPLDDLSKEGTPSNSSSMSLKENDESKIMQKSENDNGGAPDPSPTRVTSDTSRELNPQRAQMPSITEQPKPTTRPIGPPPSYSFVMTQKSKNSKPRRSLTPLNERVPPPTYSGMQRLCVPQDEAIAERFFGLPSFSEPMWRSHTQPALCPRCGIIILTSTHSQDSIATHVAALTLCLFGCWPCCLLPYCINACKNTHHHCPICQTFLGSYSPW